MNEKEKFLSETLEPEDNGHEAYNRCGDLLSSDPPTWRLPPHQRITGKTLIGAIGVLTLFMLLLIKLNGPKASDRIHGNDRERDGLKGPVQSVEYKRISRDSQFEKIARKPIRFRCLYDENGNRIEEEYFDENGQTAKRVLFTHDSLGNRFKTEKVGANGFMASESTDKQFGLFDPIEIGLLQSDPDISRYYFGTKSDSYGNWTCRDYHVRRHSKLYESQDAGNEYRTIHYFSGDPTESQSTKIRFPIEPSGEFDSSPKSG